MWVLGTIVVIFISCLFGDKDIMSDVLIREPVIIPTIFNAQDIAIKTLNETINISNDIISNSSRPPA